VASYPVTPDAGRLVAQESAERSYEAAGKHLRRHHSIAVGKELLENPTTTVGNYWLSQDQAALKPHGLLLAAPPAQMAAQTCLIFADGVMIHTDGDWHEARVGTVRSTMADQEVHTSSLVRLGELEEFGLDLWRKAQQMGYGKASVSAFIADGSHCLWSLIKGGAKPWRGAEQDRGAHAYVYPGPPGVSMLQVWVLAVGLRRIRCGLSRSR
jgi:hypothetical protein